MPGVRGAAADGVTPTEVSSITSDVDQVGVSWVQRHLIAVAVVVAAVASTGSVFAFARPTAHQQSRVTTVHMQDQRHYRVAEVRKAFAAHGLQLMVKNHVGGRDAMTILSTGPAGTPSPFTVAVFGPQTTVTFTQEPDGKSFDAQFGNVQVHYGGFSTRFRSRVEAAVAELRT